MKIVTTTTTDQETSATIDIFEGKDIPDNLKEQVAKDVGQYILEQTLASVSEQKSPLDGYGRFEPLTSLEYKKLKKKEVGNTKANIELSGETLDELDFQVTDEGIKIGVFGDRAPVADGHNNLSGKSALPLRRFIPAEGDDYNSSISKEVDRIISDAIAENVQISTQELQDIGSKADFYDFFGDYFGLTSRAEIKLAIYRNPDVLDLIDEEGLDEYL